MGTLNSPVKLPVSSVFKVEPSIPELAPAGIVVPAAYVICPIAVWVETGFATRKVGVQNSGTNSSSK